MNISCLAELILDISDVKDLIEVSEKVSFNADLRKSNADLRKFIFGSICDHLRVICDHLRSRRVFQKSLIRRRPKGLQFTSLRLRKPSAH